MKKSLLIWLVILFLPVLATAQTTGIKAESLGADAAQQKLVEISVTKFEDAAFWLSTMPLDMGLAVNRRFEGSPAEKQPLEEEAVSKIQEQDRFVLGAKVNFFRRGVNYVSIVPVKPLPIAGITKTLSVWVVGRNYNHILKAVILDYFGQQRIITLGKLNFMGWKQLTVAVPPSIIQDEYHFSSERGIKFVGFRIEFDMMESFGSYYIYFDDLRATTDLFAEEFRDADDMTDGW
jgi:hypothetical protein